MKTDDGGPAFPHPTEGFYNDPEKGIGFNVYTGMTLRDYFAGQALAGLLANSRNDHVMAIDAYELADEMLAARSGHGRPTGEA